MLSREILKRGISIPLFFLLLGATSVSAQQTDTTRQQPTQLETQPQLEGRPPAVNNPAARPPAPVVRPTPPPAAAPPRPSADTVEARQTARAGEEKEPFDLMKKLFIGGSASLGFQSSRYYGNYFNIGASPLLGYKLTKFLAIGPGLIYQFYNMGGYKVHDYGLKGFGQVTIYKSILAHFEHSVVNTQDFRVNAQGQVVDRYRTQLGTTLVGGGYRSMANDRFGMDLYVLLPVSYSTNTYNNSYAPVIRAGFIYHLK
jgi:hypothetical protein